MALTTPDGHQNTVFLSSAGVHQCRTGIESEVAGLFRGESDIVNKLRIAQIKQEAETYLSHGLHQEALAVYKRFLSTTPDLSPTLKTAISESIRRIRFGAQGKDRDEAELISKVEIALIKKGWRGHVSEVI